MILTDAELKRFAAKFEQRGPNECWLWHGAKHRQGYGQFKLRGKVELAHRVMYAVVYGKAPPALLHKCDCVACINPRHLKSGTQADNVRDMAVKHRGTNVLTPDAVFAIRADTRTQDEIAKSYMVSQSLVSQIKRGKAWKYLK